MLRGLLIGLGACFIFAAFYLNVSQAWDGYSYEKGTYIDVETYDHQGQGEGEVEYFDYSTGEYKQGYLDMESGGTGIITDYETGEQFEVEME